MQHGQMTDSPDPPDGADEGQCATPVKDAFQSFAESLGPGGGKMLLGMLAMMLGEKSAGHRLLAEAAHEKCTHVLEQQRKEKEKDS